MNLARLRQSTAVSCYVSYDGNMLAAVDLQKTRVLRQKLTSFCRETDENKILGGALTDATLLFVFHLYI